MDWIVWNWTDLIIAYKIHFALTKATDKWNSGLLICSDRLQQFVHCGCHNYCFVRFADNDVENVHQLPSVNTESSNATAVSIAAAVADAAVAMSV